MTATHTMAEVHGVIEARRSRLESRPLFSGIDGSSSMAELRVIAKQMSFYVFGFQDMLRLTNERVEEPSMREIAGRLRQEDAGHEQWFLFDLEQFGCKIDVPWIFGVEHRVPRDITYGLVSELLRAEDDRVRIVFPLVLEAAGSVFFKRVVGLIRRAGYEGPLRYFARSHQEVEAEHDIFSDEGQAELARIEFDETSFSAVVRLIHGCFDQIDRIADYLETHRRAAQ